MSANPHIRDTHSPLEALMLQALRRYGEFHPTSVDADLALLFIELANEVLHEHRIHPYHDGTDLPDYTHPAEARPVDDSVMIAGLLAHYCIQQGNTTKAGIYVPQYVRRLNGTLWHKLSGSGPIQMRPVDDGTAGHAKARKTNPHTGMPEE